MVELAALHLRHPPRLLTLCMAVPAAVMVWWWELVEPDEQMCAPPGNHADGTHGIDRTRPARIEPLH